LLPLSAATTYGIESGGQFFNRHIRDQYRYWLVTLPRSRSSG